MSSKQWFWKCCFLSIFFFSSIVKLRLEESNSGLIVNNCYVCEGTWLLSSNLWVIRWETLLWGCRTWSKVIWSCVRLDRRMLYIQFRSRVCLQTIVAESRCRNLHQWGINDPIFYLLRVKFSLLHLPSELFELQEQFELHRRAWSPNVWWNQHIPLYYKVVVDRANLKNVRCCSVCDNVGTTTALSIFCSLRNCPNDEKTKHPPINYWDYNLLFVLYGTSSYCRRVIFISLSDCPRRTYICGHWEHRMKISAFSVGCNMYTPGWLTFAGMSSNL